MTSTYDQKVAWLNGLERFEHIGGTTPGGQRVVGIKIGNRQTHGMSVWCFSNGKTVPGSDIPAGFTDLVHLVPAPVPAPWVPDEEEPVEIPVTLTADDFRVPYDNEKTFSFFEIEDGGVYFAYGHVDPRTWGEEIVEYWRYTSGEAGVLDFLGQNVQHLWVRAYAPNSNYPEEWRLEIVAEGTPGAVAVSRYEE